MVARAEQVLRADVERVLVGGAERDGCVPVEAQLLFAILRVGLDAARKVGDAIDTANLATLGFGVDVVGVRRILMHPEAIAAIHIFPARVGDAAGIGRIAHPRAVVLQPAINVVRIGHINIDVVELRDRQIHHVFPAHAAIGGAP